VTFKGKGLFIPEGAFSLDLVTQFREIITARSDRRHLPSKNKKRRAKMFKKILYPTDFSDVSKKALEYIKKLKEAGTKEVILLHVIDEREIEHISHIPGIHMNAEELEGLREEGAKEGIRAIEAELKESGLDVKVRIERGIPLMDILRVEEEEGVSAIVIGSHGKSCVTEMFLGSVSENVIRKSKKPVLVIRR
jgi:nucleotide-binding universal stress UspA family protein